jgi:hypothetical protein
MLIEGDVNVKITVDGEVATEYPAEPQTEETSGKQVPT